MSGWTVAVRHFKELIVWQKAVDLAVAVYEATKRFPSEERYGLASQLRRASVSVASNIAEGQCRGAGGDFIRFLRMARGSLGELETQLILAQRLTFVDVEVEAQLLELAGEVGRLLNGLLNSLKQE